MHLGQAQGSQKENNSNNTAEDPTGETTNPLPPPLYTCTHSDNNLVFSVLHLDVKCTSKNQIVMISYRLSHECY